MNEDIKAQFINKALEYLNSAEAFLKAEVPAYVQELLMYNFYSNLFMLISCIMGQLIIFFIVYKLYKKHYIVSEIMIPAAVIIPALTIAMIVNGTKSVDKLIKIKVAPRVFLIEHLTGR